MRSPNLKFRSRDPDHTQFIVRWLRVILNVRTTYEVSTLNRSEDIKGSQDLKMGHATQARPR